MNDHPRSLQPLRRSPCGALGAGLLLVALALALGCRPEQSTTAAPENSAKLTPEEIKEFAGRPGVAKLTWTTQSEEDNFGFWVTRCTSEAGPFERINPTIIRGADNSSTPRSYVFHDLDVNIGDVYHYQINSISIGGDVAAFGPVLRFEVSRLFDGETPPGVYNPRSDDSTASPAP
jgi:hypothetical protein